MNRDLYAQIGLKRLASVSVKANLLKQVKRSGRSQNNQNKSAGFYVSVLWKGANLLKQVKRSGRSQNNSLQKGLPV